MRNAIVAVLCGLAARWCENPDHDGDIARATAIAQAIVSACPLAHADDADARAACADQLTDLALLRDAMAEPFRWGQQSRLWDYDLSHFNTTRFNPRVF